MRRRASLRTRVLVVLALAAVLPTALVGAVAIRRARADLEVEVVRGNLALIRSLGAALDETLQGARGSMQIAAALWGDLRGAPDEAVGSRRLLRNLEREVPLLSSLSIVDPDGRHLHGDPISVPPDTGAHSFGGYIGDVVIEDGVARVQIIAQARSRTGELRGVLIGQLDLRFISDALAGARLGPGARLLVVDGDGVPVASSTGTRGAGERSLRGRDPAVDRALGSAEDGSLVSGENVVVYRNLSSFQSLRGVRWAILLEQPEREAYALARATTRDTLLIGAGVLAVFLALGALLAARLTRPLVDLAARADAVAGGTAGGDISDEDLPPPPLEAPGEIGVLAQRLEDMAQRIGERERLQAALARGDRLAAVGTMAASVAHEVNNPLTTVLGYARLLLEDKPDDHPDRAGLSLIAGEAARMQKIVGSLLDYARSRPPGESGRADVNELLRKTADLLLPTARKSRVEIALELAAALPSAAAEPDALQQIFVNLVQNAVQAMADGGVVTLKSGLVP
ncbi:MAG TPA: histidine kinase dimerization/phospho-acceptor domain-containing protein, partial [Kofleriaceae bacterium]|nr:histidine kinase dimerization/phospho-acceptor domain-containing protein [Kofleriaceae bacterium]